MTWELAVAGTVCLDDITTPRGHAEALLGGSAVYFALAAAPVTRVHLCGGVGADCEALVHETLDGAGVELAGLEVLDGPTRRWRAVHDFSRWTTASEDADEGAADLWSARLSAGALAAPVLFLGSMLPSQQLAVVRSGDWRLVGSDSMTVHIGADAATVRAVTEASDILFLNRHELAALTGRPEDQWRSAATSLLNRGRLRCVIVKAGPLGAACVTGDAIVRRQARPVEPVVDPTGAGDTLAGGFLAACAAAERDDDAFFLHALDAGLLRAAAAISDFGTLGLRVPSGPAPVTEAC